MEPEDRRDLVARERARQRRAKQIQRRRLVLVLCVVGLIVLIVALAVGLSGDDGQTTVSTTGTTEPGQTTETTEGEGGETTSTSELSSATYVADLTGDQSVPPVSTQAAAELTLTYDKDEETLAFVLEVTSMITRPNVATIYEGGAGTSGAAIVTLFAGPEEGTTFEGVLAEGFIEKEDLTGTMQGKSIPELVNLIASGNTYVSIGNASHPIDAIRGQIELESLLNTTE